MTSYNSSGWIPIFLVLRQSIYCCNTDHIPADAPPPFVYPNSWLVREAHISGLIGWPYPGSWLKDTGCLNKRGHLCGHSERSLWDKRCHVWGTYLQHDYSTVAISPHLFFIYGGWRTWHLSKTGAYYCVQRLIASGVVVTNGGHEGPLEATGFWRFTIWQHMSHGICLVMLMQKFIFHLQLRGH